MVTGPAPAGAPGGLAVASSPMPSQVLMLDSSLVPSVTWNAVCPSVLRKDGVSVPGGPAGEAAQATGLTTGIIR